jgi:MFS family permease
MGLGSLLIGLLPPASAIGITAPVLVFALRIIQGIGLGGEFGGATTWLVEFMPKSSWRTFWSSWSLSTSYFGTSLSAICFSVLAFLLPRDAFVGWGWRVVFVLGFVVAIIALFIRLKTLESPMFKEYKERVKQPIKYPALLVVKEQWKKLLLFGLLCVTVSGAFQQLWSPFSLSYLSELKVDTAYGMQAMASAALVGGVGVAVWSIISSITGKKRFFLILGNVFSIASGFPFFLLLGILPPQLYFFSYVLIALSNSFLSAMIPSFLADHFATKYRYSGAGIAYQLGTLINGLVIGFIYPAVITSVGGAAKAYPYVAGFYIFFALVGLVIACAFKDIKQLE